MGDPFRGAISDVAKILVIWRDLGITETSGIPEKLPMGSWRAGSRSKEIGIPELLAPKSGTAWLLITTPQIGPPAA